MSGTEVMVRMGELATSADPGDVLVSIGLGSCIGLAMLDRKAAVAGLAHVVLPAAPSPDVATPGKFADLAVPALLEGVCALGAARHRIEAAIVGGAQMFSFGKGALDIGARNEAATRAALEAAGVRLRAAATGGGTGRTVRVHVGEGLVTVKEAGGRDEPLLGARPLAMEVRR
jgi:chemotaxis protein CheD